MDTAKAVGRRSLCARDQVGAVIVSAENRIVDTGYNGPPAGFSPANCGGGADINRPTCEWWCERGRTQTTFEREIQGRAVEVLTGRTLAADYSDCPSLHAEANALMFGDRAQRVRGSIYVSSTVCFGCAKLIANSGLLKVFYARPAIDDSHRSPQRAMDFMMSCGLWVTEL
jgi:dCMP deaminase